MGGIDLSVLVTNHADQIDVGAAVTRDGTLVAVDCLASTYPFSSAGTGPTARAASDPTNPGAAPGSRNLPSLLASSLRT